MICNNFSLFTALGLYVVGALGEGSLFMSSFAGMETITLEYDQDCIVDPKFVVAYDGSIIISPSQKEPLEGAAVNLQKIIKWAETKNVPPLIVKSGESIVSFIIAL